MHGAIPGSAYCSAGAAVGVIDFRCSAKHPSGEQFRQARLWGLHLHVRCAWLSSSTLVARPDPKPLRFSSEHPCNSLPGSSERFRGVTASSISCSCLSVGTPREQSHTSRRAPEQLNSSTLCFTTACDCCYAPKADTHVGFCREQVFVELQSIVGQHPKTMRVCAPTPALRSAHTRSDPVLFRLVTLHAVGRHSPALTASGAPNLSHSVSDRVQ